MVEQETTTRFAYDVSWIVSAFLNACILVSMAASEEYFGERTPVSLQFLIDEGTPDVRYQGSSRISLPSALEDVRRWP